MEAIIEMRGGRLVNLADLKTEDIYLWSIRDNLAKIHRFGGNLEADYTVLHHTVIGTDIALKYFDFDTARAFFIHDFSEALMGFDMPSPIKKNFPELIEFEKNIQSVVFDWYNCKESESMHDLDYAMGYAESLAHQTKTGFWSPPRFDIQNNTLFFSFIEEPVSIEEAKSQFDSLSNELGIY